MALIAKDIEIAVGLGHDVGARASIAEHTLALWREAVAQYGATADQMLVARLWEDAAGVTLE
jgi:3-hydroxyisobutyrate dehydrogenase-like beta-hydroxyacid dehydrogenase